MMSNEEWIYGRNPVLEVLRAHRRTVKEIRIASGADESGALAEIVAHAKKRDLVVDQVSKGELDHINKDHQGVLALVSGYSYVNLEEVIDHAAMLNEEPFLLLLDVVQDPQNLGTLIRTAEAVGVHGLVIPTKRSAQVTPAVVNASSGASEHMRIALHNIAQAIRVIKGHGIWVAGMDASMQAQPLNEANMSGPIALVVGHEGSGMRRLVKESCDFLVRIPMRGRIESLNAAVAGSIALFHVWEQRDFSGSER
jgi:23S rRNA (guanosine2251-2'-O)-methyltransferase